jgi:hypothetical protein
VRRLETAIASSLLSLLTSVYAGATTPPDDLTSDNVRQDMCKYTVCQRNLHVTLKKKDGSIYDQTFALFPGAAQSLGIAIVAGQTLHVEVDVDGDTLTGFRVVDVASHPDKTLFVKLEQSEDGSMLLMVTNPFKRPLKFSMGIMPLDKPDLFKTSSCPVVAGGSSFESWPEPVFQVVLAKAHFVEAKGNEMKCD